MQCSASTSPSSQTQEVHHHIHHHPQPAYSTSQDSYPSASSEHALSSYGVQSTQYQPTPQYLPTPHSHVGNNRAVRGACNCVPRDQCHTENVLPAKNQDYSSLINPRNKDWNQKQEKNRTEESQAVLDNLLKTEVFGRAR